MARCGGAAASRLLKINVRLHVKLSTIAVAICVAGCAPVFSDFQSAKTLGQGNLEVGGSAGGVFVREGGLGEHVQNEFGAQIGVGLHQKIDFRFRYNLINIPGYGSDFNSGDSGPYNVHVFTFGPKFALVENHLAFLSTFQIAFANDIGGVDIDAVDTFNWQPTLIGTIPLNPEYAEINLGGKFIIINNAGDEPLGAVTLGFGFGKLSEWAIRPEFGILRDLGDSGTIIQVGVAYTYIFTFK